MWVLLEVRKKFVNLKNNLDKSHFITEVYNREKSITAAGAV